MDNKIILMVVVAIVLGMLVANMFKDVCGCKVVEGQVVASRADGFKACDSDANSPCTWIADSKGGEVVGNHDCYQLNTQFMGAQNPCSQNYSIDSQVSLKNELGENMLRTARNYASYYGAPAGGTWRDSVCCGQPVTTDPITTDAAKPSTTNDAKPSTTDDTKPSTTDAPPTQYSSTSTIYLDGDGCMVISDK